MKRNELVALIVKKAVLRGNFKLRSGRTSNYYIDKYLLTTEPSILRGLGSMFMNHITSDMQRLAGTELGGIPLVTAASLESGLPSILIRKNKKEYGTSKQIEGELKPGDNILLLEDVCTSGGQIIESAINIEEQGAKIVKIVCVIDREEGARSNIESVGFKFESLFTKSDLGILDD